MSTTVTSPDKPHRSTNHAKLRWLQRSDDLARPVSHAWSEGYDIDTGITSGYARLHPPTDTVLIADNGHIITVYHAHAMAASYADERFRECGDCSSIYAPEEDPDGCPWCAAAAVGGGSRDC